MKTAFRILFLLMTSVSIYAQDTAFKYELDLSKDNDAFNVTISNLQLTKNDSVFSFVSYAPGVHQPLNFGRFVKLFKVYNTDGVELITNKVSINNFHILQPESVSKIVYEIDDSFDMSIDYHPIYPMSGTGITDSYTIVNSHGVFGYFHLLKNRPIELKIKVDNTPKIGTALNKTNDGIYLADSYYQLADSPLLIGDSLTYSSVIIGGVTVEAYVHSPLEAYNAEWVLNQAQPILNAAANYIGYAPVDRYTFLMYFSNTDDEKKMPVLKFGGALEHSLSSTYALPADPQLLNTILKDIIAHEYMHILAPLHLRSEILANVDYSRPVSEDLHVWLYEGLTEWVSYAMQVRNGDVEFDAYLDYLSGKIKNSNRFSDAYSLVRISQEWSTDEGNKQYGNIYQLGALTAAMLDIKLLQLSKGEKGLREVYLELIERYGKDRPFNNDIFFDDIVAMTYPEIGDFIDNHIKNNTTFNFEAYAEIVGLSYYPKKANPENIPTMGLDFRDDEKGDIVISSFTEDNKDRQIELGDLLISVNGIELVDRESYMKIMKTISNSNVGDSYKIEISRDGKNLLLEEKLVAKTDYSVFEIDSDATEEAVFLRNKLLSNN